MKHLLLIAALTSFLFISCKKHNEPASGQNPQIPANDSLRFSFAKIDGEDFILNQSGINHTYSTQPLFSETIQVDGGNETTSFLSVVMQDDYSLGNHSVVPGGKYSILYKYYACHTGNVQIVYHSGNSIAGRFSGKVFDEETGNEVNITNGEFAFAYE